MFGSFLSDCFPVIVEKVLELLSRRKASAAINDFARIVHKESITDIPVLHTEWLAKFRGVSKETDGLLSDFRLDDGITQNFLMSCL